jgi:hypothetical protein
MDDPINQIGNVLNTSRNQMSQNRPVPKSQANLKVDNNECSSKYMIENNRVVYEKYDEYGKLIFKVPWPCESVDKKL